MNLSGIGHNYDYLRRTANYMQEKTTVREAISKTEKQPANLQGYIASYTSDSD